MMFFFFPAGATHIVGGEIGYRCLGDEQYEITLTVYRDCYYGIPLFDDPSSIGFFTDTSTVALYELLIPATFSDTLDYTLSDPCLSVPPDVCVEVMQYVDTISLPYRPGGYTIVYQRCCRNETLLNIQNPLETGASFVVKMTGASMQVCNSSPVFNNWPPLALCVDKPLDFDHSATDMDGDSIVYSLCAPYIGGQHSLYGNPMPQPPELPITTSVVWAGGYGVANMLGGVPLTIDAHTGQLTAVPNTIGQFVVGVCMKEYRDGILLSETKRDFQFNVSDCGEIVSSFFVPEIICDQLDVYFDNLSQNAADYHWDFGVDGVDGDTSNLQSPFFTYQDTGQYDVTLIAVRNETCVDTFVKSLSLEESTFDIGVDWNLLQCDDSIKVQVLDQTYDSVFQIVNWHWQFSNDWASVTSDSMNPFFVLPSGKNTRLYGLVESSNGCQKEIVIPFPYQAIDPLSNLHFQACKGDDVALNPDGNDSLIYSWMPEDALDDAHSFNPVIFDIQQDIDLVSHIISADSACSRDFSVQVQVQDISVLAQANPDTIFAGESSQLTANASGGMNYMWSPAESLNSTVIPNPLASPTETTDYQVVVTNGVGCRDSVTLRVVVLNPECALPNVFVPSGFTPNRDGQNDVFKVYGFIIETMHLMVFNRWGEKVFETTNPSDGWDGTFKGEELPPDVYGYWVKVKCINGEEYIRQGNVTLIR